MKNLVICCDGTNNQLETNATNVYRLFTFLVDDPNRQIVFYGPGVGTLAQTGIRSRLGKRINLIYGLAFGVGFTRNLEESYGFLMRNYVSGDRVYLFGFSRGAYTVRALAGMINMFGLLDPDQENLLPYISRAYNSANFDVAKKVQGISRHDVKIDFLGLWDTVTSLGFAYKRKALPYTTNNPSVRAVRHAVSIDEHRSYFRQNRWGTVFAAKQNVKEVWFAGVHSDVGGSYPEGDAANGSGNDRSALSKITLQWMVEEAKQFNMLVEEPRYQASLEGEFPAPFRPNPLAVANDSLVGPWWVAEFLPMNYTLRHNAFYLPLARPRTIPPDAVFHESVAVRRDAGIGYRPKNLPATLASIEPWSTAVTSIDKQPPVPQGSGLSKVLSPPLGLVGAVAIVYLLIVAIVLAVRLVVAVSLQPAIPRLVWPAFLWVKWLADWDHLCLLLPLVVPLVVFFVGAFILGKLSGLPDFELRIKNGKILHERIGGYNEKDAEAQLHQLREDGRRAYLKMLKLDLFFPLFYGTALIWGIHSSRLRAELPFRWTDFVPLVTVLSDWIENSVLLIQIPKFTDSQPSGLSRTAILIASVATTIKLITFTVSLLLIILFLTCKLWLCL